LRPPRSTTLLLLPGLLAVAAALPASAGAATCSNLEQGAPGAPGNELVVGLGLRDGVVTLEPVDGRLRIGRLDADEPERLVACSGPAPTLTNIDLVTIRSPRRTLDAGLVLNLEEGPLGPGATPEADGGSEIEVRLLRTGRRLRTDSRRFSAQLDLRVLGSPAADSYSVNVSRRLLSANLNASATDADADLTTAKPSFGSIAAGSGDDLVSTSLAPRTYFNVSGETGNDTLSAVRGSGRFLGGEGNDVLTGAGAGDSLFGDEGADLILGKGGRDFVSAGAGQDIVAAGGGRDRVLSGGDGETDQVSCGGSRDRFTADRADKLSGCEQRIPRRPRGPLEQPTPVP
jgi:hypothetical protein